ncbi:MAG: hypothetical protein RLZZ350_214 [Verrucomicrobiota bacterium]|jgi:hypothetical protein
MDAESNQTEGQPNSRRAIPKRIRFEVLKRDSFKCQYCGAAAPDVLLQIDHIHPVIEGGDNDITNLITSCVACNSGKSGKTLDDKTAVIKARNQLEDLQTRREQLEMMMEWKEGLRDIAIETIDRLCSYWEANTPGWSVNANGRKNLQKWLGKFSVEELTQAMDVAATQYLKVDANEKVTPESWEIAFSKIPGICRVERASKDEPELRELYYIRGIVRNKCENYFDNVQAMEWLRAARSWGIPVEELRNLAVQTRNWRNFVQRISDLIQEYKQQSGAE